MYVVLGISVLCIFMLAYPPTTYIIDSARGPISFRTEMGLAPFLVTMAVLGFFMSLGKAAVFKHIPVYRSEEHTSELQSLMRISYAVFCLKKKRPNQHTYNQLYYIHTTAQPRMT